MNGKGGGRQGVRILLAEGLHCTRVVALHSRYLIVINKVRCLALTITDNPNLSPIILLLQSIQH